MVLLYEIAGIYIKNLKNQDSTKELLMSDIKFLLEDHGLEFEGLIPLRFRIPKDPVLEENLKINKELKSDYQEIKNILKE